MKQTNLLTIVTITSMDTPVSWCLPGRNKQNKPWASEFSNIPLWTDPNDAQPTVYVSECLNHLGVFLGMPGVCSKNVCWSSIWSSSLWRKKIRPHRPPVATSEQRALGASGSIGIFAGLGFFRSSPLRGRDRLGGWWGCRWDGEMAGGRWDGWGVLVGQRFGWRRRIWKWKIVDEIEQTTWERVNTIYLLGMWVWWRKLHHFQSFSFICWMVHFLDGFALEGVQANCIPPWKLTYPLKIDGWKMTFPWKRVPF